MRVVKLILLIAILSLAVVNVVEAKTYIVNFDYIGGVEVKTDSPFPKGWKNSGNLWANGDSAWESPPADYTAGMGSAYTQSDIDAVEALDGVYSRSSTTASDTSLGADAEYAVQEFKFSVATTATSLEINAYVTDEDDGIQAYIWNFATNSWELYADYSNTDIGWMWINFSTSSPSSYISSSGEVYVLFQSQAYAGWLGSDTANVDVDYIEAVAVVPDTSVQSACLNYISGAPRDWDGIFDDDTFSILFRVTDSSGNPIANYPGFIRLIWDSSYSDFAANWSNSTGYLTLSGKPIHGGVSDKWRVTFRGVIKDVMINGVAYQYDPSCSQPIATQNVAITPGSYDIMLVGRRWDNTGEDWIVFRWIADPEDVEHVNKGGYDLPVVQKFRNWDLLYWKLGVPNPNHDDDGMTEGVYGNSNDVNYESYPACIGPDTPPSSDPRYCGNYICQDDGRCCYNDVDKDHDCSLHLTGYRFGPFVEINAPDHAIGVVVANTIDTCNNLNTTADILAQPYDAHEGGGQGHEIHCEVAGVGIDTITTEYAFHEGYTVLLIFTVFDADPHEGFGLPGFIGLMPDSEHVVGLVLGHRYGIHPFVSLVTSMPSNEIPVYDDHTNLTAKSIWESSEFYKKWIYYLLRNTAYSIEVMAGELSNWDKRYPSSGEDNIILANLALNDVLLDFLPYLNTTIWTIQVTGNNTINTFIVTSFTNLYGIARIVNQIVSDSSLLSEFENVIGTALKNLPDILGPPDASTGLNYLLRYRNQIPYSDRENFTARAMELLNNVESLMISLLKNLPPMETSGTDPSFPGWNYGDWVADGHT